MITEEEFYLSTLKSSTKIDNADKLDNVQGGGYASSETALQYKGQLPNNTDVHDGNLKNGIYMLRGTNPGYQNLAVNAGLLIQMGNEDSDRLIQYNINTSSGEIHVSCQHNSTSGWTEWTNLTDSVEAGSISKLGVLTYQNNWVYKIGRLYFINLICYHNSGDGIPNGGTIGTVPAGFRPAAAIGLPAMCRSNSDAYWMGCTATINPNGSITVATTKSIRYVNMSASYTR